MENRKKYIPVSQEIKMLQCLWVRGQSPLKLTDAVIIAFFVIFVSVFWAVSQLAASEQSELHGFVQEALSNNNELISLQEHVTALESEAPYAGSLQDPILGFGIVNVPVDSFELDQEPMTQKQLFVSQKFPWFGTLGFRQQIAEIKALEARSRLLSKMLDVKLQVINLWYEINSLYRSFDLIASLQDIVTQSLRIAESRYATGKGLQQDILVGQVELTELIRENVIQKSKILAKQAQFAALLNRSESVSDRAYYQKSINEIPLLLSNNKELVEQGYMHSPVLVEKKLSVDRSRIEVQLAQAAYYPDFNLRLSYGQREDDPATGSERADFFSASLAMSVPLYRGSRQDVKLKAAEHRLTASLKSLDGFRRIFPHKVSRLVTEIEGLQENFQLLSDTLTIQASYLADASLAAYSVGKVEFGTMLTARMSLLRLESKADIDKNLIYQKIAELEQLLGVSLSAQEGS